MPCMSHVGRNAEKSGKHDQPVGAGFGSIRLPCGDGLRLHANPPGNLADTHRFGIASARQPPAHVSRSGVSVMILA